MINVCEARTDALAIIDIPGIYIPRAQTKTGFGPQFSLDTCVSTFKGRATNSSYACTYYPWLKVVDTVNGNQLWAPPSVAMLGVLSSVDKKADPWFAPAGFTRGGLTEGAAGIPVVAVCEQLTAKQRDKLYEANINPIAQFPTEGIVVYGQKTLQVTKSALDRINVRRMLIYVKREISKIAATTLFEPDVQTTWTIFSGRCTEVLSSVKARLGIADFKLVLDETTTTPDLVDRNIMYAKIYLKPVKAIEFIAVDFVITNAGASFED
jgi:phage tail sheath protein FI